MTREHRRTRSLQRWLAAALLLIGNSLATGSALAEGTALITGDPVPARELANMLYPPRTRGIVMQQIKPTPFAFLVQFEFDSAQVKPESRSYLDEVGKMMSLRRLAGKRVQIVGHADASGGEEYNQRLSERRALAVSQYLSRYHGVELERLPAAGLGESDPLDPTNPLDARNRRVQFHPVD